MKEISKQNLLNSIGEVYENAKGCKLSEDYFVNNRKELKEIADYCNINEKQAFFLAIIFVKNAESYHVDWGDLIYHTNCNPVDLLRLNDDFQVLINLNMIIKENKRRRTFVVSNINYDYYVHEKIINAILNNQPFPKKILFKPNSIIDLLLEYKNQTEKFMKNKENIYYLKFIFQKQMQFSFVKNLESLHLDYNEMTLFLLLIIKNINEGNVIDVNIALSDFVSKFDVMKLIQKIIHKESNLEKLIEIDHKSSSANDLKITLSSYAISWLKKHELEFSFFNGKKDDIICPKDIKVQDLFYNVKEKQEIYFLENVLQKNKFKEIQDRLTIKNLPKGIAVLMYGSPGTGKTETVKQIAKRTNRKILKVDISSSKSMWFGESEKITKRIFEDYKTLADDSDETPILFFNEADAIFSKRLNIGNSNLAKTENAIQNIILEEMENFEGILMATTNLTDNLDTAFERRFLFKIEFKRPELDTNQKIWKNKFSFLTREETQKLACYYSFSGGQIANVKRKVEIQQVIFNQPITFESIVRFCKEEKELHKKVNTIGF